MVLKERTVIEMSPELAMEMVHGCFYGIGNGMNTFTWLNPQLNHCPLIQRFSNRTIAILGGSTSHTIEQSIIDGSWALTSDTTSIEEALNILNENIPSLSNAEDCRKQVGSVISLVWLISQLYGQGLSTFVMLYRNLL